MLSNLIAIAEKFLDSALNENEKEDVNEVANAIDRAQSIFHKQLGDRYGSSGSTFIDRECNQEKLLLSTFPGGRRLSTSDLNPEGFDGSPEASKDAVSIFLKAFYGVIDRTTSRDLNRDITLQKIVREYSDIREGVGRIEIQARLTDAKVDGIDRRLNIALNEKVLPCPILNAIAEPSLKELSKLLKDGRAKDALTYAEGCIKAIDIAIGEDAGPEKRYAEALRTHLQRLLFAAASAASWLGNIDLGRTFWWRAHGLGLIEPEWHQQAVITLFNIGLKDELRHFMKEMDKEGEVYRKIAVPCLAYLAKDWFKVDELLVDVQGADWILLRIEARLQIIDFKEIEAVKLTDQLLGETDHDTALPVVNLIRAQLTLELVKRVIIEYTPLGYNRRSLINSLIDRINVALETTEHDSIFRAQALCCLRIAAELFRDSELNERFESEVEILNEEIRSSVFPLYGAVSTPEKIQLLQTEGHFDAKRATILRAKSYQGSVLPENVESDLYEALFASVEKHERKYALRLLLQHLRQTNRTEEARRLIDTTPLRPADNWLVRTENLPAGKTPLDLVDEVEIFPLDVDVIERLAKFTLSTVQFTSPENSLFERADLNRAEDAVRWATRLVEVLPSRSSRFHYALALYAARRYRELLTISQDLDPIYAEQAAEFKAWALIGLGQRKKAIECFISASEIYPESIRFAIHASHFLLIENQPEEVEKLLESHITAGSQDPDILLFYARSIHNQAPSSQEHASRAFDLLAQIYKLQPDPNIAQEAWQTARAAGREQEAKRFFDAMAAEMPVKVVETEDIFSQAMQAAGEKGGILIKGGLEYLGKIVHEDRKRSEFLEGLLHAHALAYVDFFRYFERSWELWAYWTQRFQQRRSSDQISPGEFSVLAEWPFLQPRYDHHHNPGEVKLFLDQTAILTLGVLGPRMTEQILITLRKCYVHAGTMEELGRDLTRINGHLRTSNASPYIKAATFFRQRPDAVVLYSKEIEVEAPNEPSLGPCRVDLGVAMSYNAPYVTDLNNSEDWTEDTKSLRISSAVLLASLNEAGEVTKYQAKDAAKKHPNTFDGWNTATPQPIPEAIVFDEYSILDWVDTGLANVLGNRIKVGPWVWTRISEEAGRQEAMELARERLKDTRRVLQAALDEDILVEIKVDINTNTPGEENDELSEEIFPIREFWSDALKSLRTAQSHGLQLWADDCFYPLLLRFGGPMNMGAEVHAIRALFADWAEEMPPLSTMELLDQLSSAGRLSSTVAQNAADKLFSQGYRTVHPLLLAHTLRQYPMSASDGLTPPFQKLVDAITEIPHYCTETFADLYGNRDGFICLASISLAKRLIIGVWESEGLSDDKCCILADAFLKAIEHVFDEMHTKDANFRTDRTRIIFWQDIAYSLQMIPDENESTPESCFAALQWLGRAAASRLEQREEITRVLEDNILDSLKYALKAFEDSIEKHNLRQIISTFVVRAFIPLTDPNFNDILDLLIRRTVSMLARFTGGGRITRNYYHNPERDSIPLQVFEKEDEKAAAKVLVRIASGDSQYVRFIWGVDLVFSYTHPVPEEWGDEGIQVDVRCSLFNLLWDSPPDLRENIVRLLIYHLSIIDPALAYQIVLIEDNLLSDDAEKVQEAHDRLGVELLRSGYLDLQRNLVHAVQRFSQYDTEAFSQFIGWIGEDAAQSLASHPTIPHVWQIGSLLVPSAHLLGRALLTDQFDDGHLVLERVEQLIDPSNDQGKQNTATPKLKEWLEDKVRAAEHVVDPFVAAWALRAVLLSLSMVDQDLELNINGRVVKISNWASDYIAIALAPNVNQSSEIKQRMIERRQLASATLLLASFICSGHKHREAFDQGEDPRAIWLEHVWLMATKLQIALISLRGGLSNAVKSATKAVQELELDVSDVTIIDAFDPFAFGLNGDDIGVALTLTAILKVVHQLSDNNERPTWWTDAIYNQVEKFANEDSNKTLSSEEEIPNRFGLAAPLRVRPIAQKLRDILPRNLSTIDRARFKS